MIDDDNKGGKHMKNSFESKSPTSTNYSLYRMML